MIRSLLLSSVLTLSLSCAARQNPSATTPVAARRADAPTMVGPAVAPEADPENVERRFGFAEARARREKAAADQSHGGHAGQGTIGVVTGGNGSPPTTPAGHDHGASGASPAPAAKPGEHQHGAGDQNRAGGKHMCPCMAGAAASDAAGK